MAGRDSISPDEIETGTAGRACDACHKKKTKCDMQQPVCGLCRRTNKECHFPSTRKRPSRQEPSVRAKLQKVNGNLDRLVELLEANPGLEGDSLKGLLGDQLTSDETKGSTHTLPKLNASSASRSTTSPQIDNVSSATSAKINEQAIFPVPYQLAMHLIDVYFDKVQPWLPIFHKPTFVEWAGQTLTSGDDALAHITVHEGMMFNGLFALAARFSDHKSLASVASRDRGEQFMRAGEQWMRIVRDMEEFNLTVLKGGILLACYHYASGNSRRGWYIAHMCSRGCYELGIHQIDAEDEDLSNDADSWVEKESLRRVFWSLWEIDSFGSIIKRKPFAIDWRHIQVKMPVNDEAWFSGEKVESAKLIPGIECWKTLVGSPNQDERAWSLLSKAAVGHIFDLMLFKEGITADKVANIEDNLSCFKLAMPEAVQLTSSSWSSMDLAPARKNWAIATNLYISSASFLITRMPIIGQPPPVPDVSRSKEIAAYSARVAHLNQILKRWPADSIPYAHPFLSCTTLTYDESLVNLLPPSPTITAYRDLSGLILAKVAERWKLGAVLLKVRELAHNYQNSDASTRAELVRQYPVYFDREIRRSKESVLQKASRIITPATSSPSDSIQILPSIEHSLSPEHSSQSGPISIPHMQRQQQQLLPPPEQQIQTQPQIQQQPQQQDQQQQQQPTPPLNYLSDIQFDQAYNPQPTTVPSIPNTTNKPDDNPTPTFQDFNSFSTFGQQSPEDIDALFSGFLQEPWWQDFSAVNFVV